LEPTHDSFPDNGLPVEPRAAGAASASGTPTRASLPAKGACWYCDKPLDSVKRFCGKPCANSFDEEAEFAR